MRFAVAVIVAAFMANPSRADASEKLSVGNGYYSQCVATSDLRALCFGYFMGIADAPFMNTGTKMEDAVFCPPPGATYQQNMDIFHAFLRGNPRLRTVNTSLLFSMAMNEAFPCRNSPYFTPDLERGGMTLSKPAPRDQ